MSNVYTLDNLKSDLDNEFAPVEIDLGNGKTVVLRNVMRMSKAERAQAMAAIEATQTIDTNTADGVDAMLDALKELLVVVAKDNTGKALVAAIGDDLALAMKIMGIWSEGTQSGEASNSPS